MITVLGVLILVCALFLVISVLLQSSKNHRMSGVVSGGAETFFGKQKGKTIDAKLSKATAIISVIFCILILVLYYVTANENKPANDADNVNDNYISAEDLNANITDDIEIIEDDAEADDSADAADATDDTTAEDEVAGENADDAEEALADDAAEEAPADDAAEEVTE